VVTAVAGVLVVVALTLGAFFAFRGDAPSKSTPITVVPANALGILDPSTGKILKVVKVDTSPTGVTVGGGSVWVANGDGTVTRIDERTYRATTIGVGGSLRGIAAGTGAVWALDGPSGAVSPIDERTGTVGTPGQTSAGASSIAVSDGAVWVTGRGDTGAEVARYDLATGKRFVSQTGFAAAASVGVGEGAAWVALPGEVLRFDLATGEGTDTVTYGLFVGRSPAVVAGAGGVWAIQTAKTVIRIDPATKAITARIAVGEGAGALALGFGALWVTNAVDGTISKVDIATDRVVATFKVGNVPTAVAVGRYLYVAVQGT
jgi:DNA-binding beta-propeller fold protein YncE